MVNYQTEDTHLDSDAQFDQWELLSSRPNITAVLPFSAPSDILGSFSSPSIGSFGVFYEKNGQIEVAHSTAELVSCSKPMVNYKQNTKCIINGLLEKYHHETGEACVAVGLHRFLTSLLQNKIGAVLDCKIATHHWLVAYVMSKLNGSANSLSSDFFDGFSIRDVEPEQADNISVLLIDCRDYPEAYRSLLNPS